MGHVVEAQRIDLKRENRPWEDLARCTRERTKKKSPHKAGS
jgi:hypothetical protein